MGLKIGFAKREITPPVGVELGGYAGYRPCAGVHDPLWCKAVVLRQAEEMWALLSLDLLSVDESLSNRITDALTPLGITRVIVAAIHSHAAPCGMVLDEGPLAEINRVSEADPESFRAYMRDVISNAVAACHEAAGQLETFKVRYARGVAPKIGSERHTGAETERMMTVVEVHTLSGRSLILYQIPCHPTVLGPENLLASADFLGGIEEKLDADMAVFLNGAAGDISTRFTRREQTFAECRRMAEIAAESVRHLIKAASFGMAQPISAMQIRIPLRPKAVVPYDTAQKALDEAMRRWQMGAEAGLDPGELRILKSYVEGATVALEFSRTMAGIDELRLPVTVFGFGGVKFFTVPGELFSCMCDLEAVPICYANGYYRYIAPRHAYDLGYYEATAAILEAGQGEILLQKVTELLEQI